VCPVDKVCIAGGGCALQSQLDACMGIADMVPCSFEGATGACMGGVCIGSLCGNGVVDDGEVCDDGNTVSGDGCRRDCLKIEVCGDGIIDANEGCDDGSSNGGSNSGGSAVKCSTQCQLETCGNGVMDPGEVCDDHNNIDRDGCSANCQSNETCGNGFTDFMLGETCDDGNKLNHDGCDSNCQLELPVWTQALPIRRRDSRPRSRTTPCEVASYCSAAPPTAIRSSATPGSGTAPAGPSCDRRKRRSHAWVTR
jgi:cysteine-rich repeat protein